MSDDHHSHPGDHPTLKAHSKGTLHTAPEVSRHRLGQGAPLAKRVSNDSYNSCATPNTW